LACSFHEVAQVLGTDLVESDLLPIFESFIHDQDPAISGGVMRHLAEFLAVISPSWRESYLPLCEEQLEKAAVMNWRAREALAKQLGGLARLFSPEAVSEVLVPLSDTLLKDNVATVRQAAIQAVPLFLTALAAPELPSLKRRYVSSLCDLAKPSSNFQERQTFVQLAVAAVAAVAAVVGGLSTTSLVGDGSSTSGCASGGSGGCGGGGSYDEGEDTTAFLQLLVTLASDSVPGVRIAVAKGLQQLERMNAGHSHHHPLVQQIRQALDQDLAVLRACPPLSAPPLPVPPPNSAFAVSFPPSP
jgi:hypothetical protein